MAVVSGEGGNQGAERGGEDPPAAALVPGSAAQIAPQALLERAADVAAHRAQEAATEAPNTVAAYAADWRTFEAWRESRAFPSLMPVPVELVVLYLAHLGAAGRAMTTIERALTGIGHAHKAAGYAFDRGSPMIRAKLAALRGTVGRSRRKKAPVRLELLRRMIGGFAGLEEADRALRTAVLLMGWAFAARRSEVVALDVGEIRPVPQGIEVQIAGLTAAGRMKRTKVERDGTPLWLPIATAREENAAVCPVRALAAWLRVRSSTAPEGELALFGRARARAATPWRLRGRELADFVKDAARSAGLDPKDFAGHSLRRGLATELDERGVSSTLIQSMTRHASEKMLNEYIERNLWKRYPLKGIL